MRAQHVAVIGAGVIGACLAVRLAEAGVAVTLFDRDTPGRATTRSSLAWLNANDKHPRAYHDLNHAGMRAWADLAARLDGDTWYRPVGNLAWAEADAECERLAERVRRLEALGYAAHLIDRETAREVEPALDLPSTAPAVAWFPEEGYLLTEPLVTRLVDYARRCGVKVRTGRSGEVTGIDGANRADGGAVTIATAAGEAVPVDTVICCAGRWAPGVAALADGEGGAETGVDALIPLVPWQGPGDAAPGFVVRVGPVAEPFLGRVIHGPAICARPHEDTLHLDTLHGDALHLEAPDAAVDLHTPDLERERWAEELLHRARRYLPDLARARALEHRVCVRPMPVDGHSIVGWLPGTGRVYVAVTHSGATLAAHLAELITTELTGGPPHPDLAPYRPDRFATSQ